MPTRPDLDISIFLEQKNQIFAQENYDFIETPVFMTGDTPVKTGGGVSMVSSSKSLERYPSVCWDVNGYYRELGVSWRATRRQLMEAYRDSGGPNSDRLTYVFRQLLQSSIRREYDAMPPGSVFLDDYVQQQILHNAKMEAARRSNQGWLCSPERVLEEWGFNLTFPSQEEDEDDEVDSSMDLWENLDVSEEEEGAEPWPYSYYRLGTSCQDVLRMVQWQQLLIEEFFDRGIVERFAVGFTGRHEAFHIGSVDDLPVFYLADTIDPDETTAKALIERYLYKGE